MRDLPREIVNIVIIVIKSCRAVPSWLRQEGAERELGVP